MERKKPDLTISRLPEKTKEEFIKLAEDEFSGDYGMCLKECLDRRADYKIIISKIIEGASE